MVLDRNARRVQSLQVLIKIIRSYSAEILRLTLLFPKARRAIPITEVAAEPLIGLTREDYPNYYDYLSIIFSKVKQKPRVVEEHDSFSAVMSAVEAGTGVAIATDFGYSFGNRLKFLHITPEPKPISVGIAAPKGRLSLAAEKFWECAKEAAAKK